MLGSRLVDGADGIDGSGVTCRVGALGVGGISISSSSMSICVGGTDGIEGGREGTVPSSGGSAASISMSVTVRTVGLSCSVTVTHCSQ